LLIGSDFERGGGQQFEGLTHLPPPAALGFLDDVEVTRKCGEITAGEARQVGINWIYAPVVDLDNEPQNPIVQTRSFGDDPARVGRMASAWIAAAEQSGVVSSAKHYPGHGRTTSDSHAGLPAVDATFDDLRDHDLEPFRAAVSAGVRSVMTAHVSYPRWDASGLPATLSSRILSYLRNEIRFQGIVVTDALIMEGALRGGGGGDVSASIHAIRAGCDALLYPRNAGSIARALEGAATEDPAMRVRAEEAVERIRALAQTMNSVAVPTHSDDLAENRKFADAVADRAIHTLRGDSLALRPPLSLSLVDDDLGGPYAVGPRDILATSLTREGIELGKGGANLLVIFSEPRSWKGHALLSARSVADVNRLATQSDLVLLFGHPRLLPQIPGTAPVVCVWHGQPLMQGAAARWVAARMR
jgi:beta-glucosidase-like glycosyl hydrolase